MGWLNGGPDGGEETSDTQSSRSASPPQSINSKTASSAVLVHELATQMTEHEEEARGKDVQLQQAQKRVDSVEKRIRERDAQVTSLKEEKAGCLRQIADLKNQLYQLQFEVEETTSDKATAAHEHQAQLADAQRELLESKRALDKALQTQADVVTKVSALEQENNALRKQLQAHEGSKDEELFRLQKQLAELKTSHAELGTQLAEEKANETKNKQLNSKEVSNLRSMLRARDDAIQSLQGRLENSQEEMTALEAELDALRNEKDKSAEREDAVAKLQAENDEASKLIEEQNQMLKDMTAKYDKQQAELEDQSSMLKQGKEAMELLKSQLEEGEMEKEASLVRSESLTQQTHSRVSTLEMELQTMTERADELTSSLNEAMEELSDLQADVVFKEGKISSLEKEIEEASRLLETRAAGNDVEDAPASPGRERSGNFARLREEIKTVTGEMAKLESDHARQISLLKTSKDADVAKLEKELDEVQSNLTAENEMVANLKASLEEAEKGKAELSRELEKTREVMDQLDAEEDRELEESRKKAEELQEANDKLKNEIEDLKVKLKDTKKVLAERESDMEGELREARQALIALDKERSHSPNKDTADGDERVKALSGQLDSYREQVRASEGKLARTVREKEMIISDLRSELSAKVKFADDLKEELESLQVSVERGPSKRNYGMSIDPEWHEPDTISKLKTQVSTLSKEKRMMESELRAKIEARDATIATLVLSASNQESNIVDLKSEVSRLQIIVGSKSLSDSLASEQLKELDTARRQEVDRLKERTQELTIELKQTKRQLLSVTEELECAKAQLGDTNAMPDVQDLAGRLIVSEQAQKMLKTENEDKLKERDAAIANLLQSMQANDGVLASLRADVERFKAKFNQSNEENRRLQHESEIFAAQIIDQDEDFEKLNAKLKEKTSEIASLKREIASSSGDVRNVKNLERQLDELRDEKRRNLAKINRLEMDLRDVELRKAKEDGFEVDRLKLELKNAIDEKVATEERLNGQMDSLRKLRNHAVEDFEAKLCQRDDKISTLENELLALKEKAAEDDFDDVFLEDEKAGGQSKKQLVEERDMLLAKLEAIGEEIETLKATKASDELSELRSKLARSEQLRDELETDLSLETDRLRKNLSEAKEAHAAREMEQLSLLKKLECENGEIREEFANRMREKNAKIVALEQTLAAQEQVVGNMSNEMDQLQNGMEKISVQRRAEIEEMSQELMDYTSKATKLEREVIALSMKLDEKKLKHKAEVAKLKDRIATLESETPLERIVRDSDTHGDKRREQKLEEQNDHLKWLNSSLKDEKEKLKEKVDKLKKAAKEAAKRDDSPSASKHPGKNSDKWRNVALQEQVAVLSQRVIELEEAASKAASHSRRPPQSPRPSILHSPVIRSSLESGSGSTTRPSSAPKSALRVSTYDSDANQANRDLLSSSDDELGRVGVDTRTSGSASPPLLPRPIVSPEKSSKRSSSSRFSLKKRSSKDKLPSSPMSSSTANYDF